MPVGNELFVQAEDDLKAHQRFVIAKIQEGKKAWNAWRKSNANKLIDLSGVDFTTTEHHHTNYSEYQFGNYINFNDATFGDDINFSNATFGDDIDFSNATFGDNNYFSNATFHNHTNFSDITFGKRNYFHDATFGNGIDFRNATFGDNNYFSDATFGHGIDFSNATFGHDIDFSDATFGDNIDFSNAIFRSKVTFSGLSKGHSFNLSLATFGDIPEVTLRSEDDKVGFNLAGSTFSINGHIDINTFSKIQVLKSIADATASINVSRDLFILQRRAERSIAWDDWSKGYVPFGYKLQHIQASIMAFLFSVFSDFGRSVFQPIAWLIGCNIFFYYIYIWLFDRDLSEIETSSLRDFTLTNSLPFGRLLNPAFESSVKILFARTEEIIAIPFSIQLAGIAQGVISVVMLFLIGLGIRNYFKIS